MANKQNVVFSRNPIIQACYRIICDPNSKIEQLEGGWVPDTDTRMPYYVVGYKSIRFNVNSKYLVFGNVTMFWNQDKSKSFNRFKFAWNEEKISDFIFDFEDIEKLYRECKTIYNNPKLKTEPATLDNVPKEIRTDYLGVDSNELPYPYDKVMWIMQQLHDCLEK